MLFVSGLRLFSLTVRSLPSIVGLRENTAYKSLVNVKAPVSEEGMNYVTPGDPHNSFILEILEENPIHKDMFNSTGKQEILALIKTWIQEGAPNN